MKTTSLLMLVSAACTGLVLAEPDSSGKSLQAYPKNLARQHLGSNLFVFNSANQTYAPTEAASAWLDDDATTGAAMLPGKQNYLLALTEPEVLSNFSISTRAAAGTVSLFTGDEPAVPGAKSWTSVAKDVPLESVNDRKLTKPFSRLAKYLLIQTDISEPGPVFSLYVYGEKPAVSYSLRKREQTIDARAIFGQYVADSTNFNLSSLHAGSRVTYANSGDGFAAWQKAIDDNPESSLAIAPSTTESGAIVAYDQPRKISRVSVLTEPGAKGELFVYAVKTTASEGGVTRSRSAMPIEGLTPVSIVLDGSNARASIDFPVTEASQVALRWAPATAGEKLAIRELGTYGEYTLNDYEVSQSPEAIAEYRDTTGRHGDRSKDGKDFIDPKKNPEPVALGPSSPYLPGALGFPPNIRTRNIQPPSPASP